MKPHVSIITLGVKDMNRAKRFYGEGLGWPIQQDYGEWVAFGLAGGAQTLGLLSRDGLASDVGAPAGGDGLSGVVFSYVVRSNARVDAVLEEAACAGATIARPAASTPWGGYVGYFADPEGFLWRVLTGSGQEPYSE